MLTLNAPRYKLRARERERGSREGKKGELEEEEEEEKTRYHFISTGRPTKPPGHRKKVKQYGRIRIFLSTDRLMVKLLCLNLKKIRSKFAGVSFSFCYAWLFPRLAETRRDAFNAYSPFHWRPPPSFSLSYSFPPPLLFFFLQRHRIIFHLPTEN